MSILNRRKRCITDIYSKLDLIDSKLIFLQKKTFISRLENLRFFKKTFEKNLKVSLKGISEHDPCISYCMLYAFGVCNKEHTYVSEDVGELVYLFSDMRSNIRQDLYKELDEYYDHLVYYLAHQVRKVYLNAQFNANLVELDEDGAVIVVDYKMKILPKSARETKSDFFGKKGWSLHSTLIYTKSDEFNELNIQAFDHWSSDSRQDAWFTASSLHAVIESLETKPKWISILSDNGPHYHNTDLMIIMSHWIEWYGIHVKKWVFLEAGEAKTTIDSHHAQVCITFFKKIDPIIYIYRAM